MAFRSLAHLLTHMADLIWPPQSLLSGQHLSRVGVIEPALWQSIDFLSGPLCFLCGVPMPDSFHIETQCLACLAAPPDFDSARAAFAYDDVTRSLVLALKRAGRGDGVPTFALWMASASHTIHNTDLIIPVPLHWTRLLQRGFNQSAWLAGSLAKRTTKAWNPSVLVRRHRSPSQAGLSAAGRRRNVSSAFSLSTTWKAKIKGKNILLVDDVFTTGATVEACARVLRRAGAARIDVICLARVVKPARLDG